MTVDAATLVDRARSLLARQPVAVLPADQVAELSSGTPIEAVLAALVPLAAEYARPELSGYRVGAAGLGISGAIILGANIEFAGEALGQTVHAEQCLVANAAAAGETGITLLAISAAPCGHCRQFLHELAEAKHLRIVIPGREPRGLDAFLPDAFGPADLGVSGGLLQPCDQGLVAAEGEDTLSASAIAAANASYAPYSAAPAGVALEFADGASFAGSYMENAAFNPGLPALQAALCVALMAGRTPSDLVRAAIAQAGGSNIDHIAATRDVLRRLAPAASIQTIELTPP